MMSVPLMNTAVFFSVRDCLHLVFIINDINTCISAEAVIRRIRFKTLCYGARLQIGLNLIILNYF